VTTAPQIQIVIDAATAALTSWNTFVERLSSIEGPKGETFDLEKPIPNLVPQNTIKQIETKLTGAIGLAHNLSSIESLELIPDSVVNEMTTRVGAVRTIVDKLVAQLNAVEMDATTATLDSLAMTAANEKGQQVNLPPIFLELYPALQAVLTVLYQLRSMVTVNEEGGLGLQFSQLDAARSAQRRTYGELNRLRRAVSASRQELDSLVSKGQAISKEIESLKSAASGNVTRTEEAKTKSDALAVTIAEINTKAEQLNVQVNAYQETFKNFQEQLNNRNQEFTKGSAEQTRLLSDIAAIQKEIERLQERSREVLGEATMTGLSESFAREMNASGRQLFRTQLLFFFSIGLLLFAAGVVLNAFPWLEGWVKTVRLEPPAGSDSMTIGIFYIGNFIGKAIFLVPPLLLLAFAARRYAEIFRLKTHYTYKYTVAASLPGFKVEAPNFADAITASAYQKLVSDEPYKADTSDDKNKQEGSTILQRIIEPIVTKALAKLSEVPKPPGAG
jgi:hypothetical protein